ncbi:nitroreductase/quinone reductase family protein [Jiangella asiatica]|uniref:DUF385 domain-containing protein n=1 Tax=Jiangella asiatica TaxID=2530372 RepID=A0A4R5D404_9ACTN|nr:nitroreductase/quinone reductase family protein [Jiangella asiatica]TDE08122.1 DUF385 domain-containing protein [Jiangella asiatica]
MLPDLDDDARARAEERLREQTVVWLTTVSADGQPQTSPVGFVWDGESFLILSQPGQAKVRNLGGNPRVSLHLDLDGEAERNSVLTVEGVATVDPAPPGGSARLSEDEAAVYVERYLESMEWAGTTPEATFADFSTVIRVTPTRARSW